MDLYNGEHFKNGAFKSLKFKHMDKMEEKKLAFFTALAGIMDAHKVTACCIVYSMNEKTNNTVVVQGGAPEDLSEAYNRLSDLIQDLLTVTDCKL